MYLSPGLNVWSLFLSLWCCSWQVIVSAHMDTEKAAIVSSNYVILVYSHLHDNWYVCKPKYYSNETHYFNYWIPEITNILFWILILILPVWPSNDFLPTQHIPLVQSQVVFPLWSWQALFTRLPRLQLQVIENWRERWPEKTSWIFFHRTRVELPIHFCYQAPSDSWYKMVDVPAPLVFQQCQKTKREDLETSCLPECKGKTAEQFPCSVPSREWCLWEHIDISVETANAHHTRAVIPRGLEGHVAVVVMATVMVAQAGTLYLVYIMVQ